MGYSKGWKNVLDFVYDFEEKTPMRRVWYRGHNNSSYKLKSSLLRDQHDDELSYIMNEGINYETFRNYGLPHQNMTGWELVFLMQHHGVKTRLLDWTESFAIALFFSCINWNDSQNNARIWLLDPAQLNRLAIETPNAVSINYFEQYEKYLFFNDTHRFLPNSVAIYPPRMNARIISQKGVFTLQGNEIDSLDEEFEGDLLKTNHLTYIELTPELKEDALRFIDHCGITYFTLFPDLDGLAKHANRSSERVHALWNRDSSNSQDV